MMVIAAALGFVAAIAATPDDELRRSYQQGYVEGMKSQQNDAVRRGYATWLPADGAGTPESFRWASQMPRVRGGRMLSDQQRPAEPSNSTQHQKKTLWP